MKEKYDKKHSRDVFNSFLLADATYSIEHELPLIKPTNNVIPKALIPFSVAASEKCTDFDCFVHFYEDDYKFERIWNNPKKYLERLKQFEGVIMPDFSTSIDFPQTLKLWSAYKNQALAYWFQNNEIITIPNARTEPNCNFLVEALPKNSTISICGRACLHRLQDRRCFIRDLKSTIDILEPTAIIYYGSVNYDVLSYPRDLKIPIYVYSSCTRGTIGGGRSGQLAHLR